EALRCMRSRARDDERTILRAIGEPAVRATHEGRVERNDIEKRPEAERFLEELPGDAAACEAKLRVEEELERIVARLAVDLDRARKVGRAAIVEPIDVVEPSLGRGDADELARPRIVEPVASFAVVVEDEVDTVHALEKPADGIDVLRVPHVDVRELMVGDGERP